MGVKGAVPPCGELRSPRPSSIICSAYLENWYQIIIGLLRIFQSFTAEGISWRSSPSLATLPKVYTYASARFGSESSALA